MLGDLTFFYDMNALWNKYIRNNVRILLFNNGGASLFYYNTRGLKNFPSLDKNAGAAHVSSAKAWAECRGFKYITANNKEDFDCIYQEFIKEDSDKPILFEVFTDRAVDGEAWHSILSANTPRQRTTEIKAKIKAKIKAIVKH